MPPRLRPLCIFLATLVVYGVLSGPRLLRPSPDNHFCHLAAAWLAGRLDLPGRPPHRNDWGRVTTWHLTGGRTIRGIPCRTPTCEAARRRGKVPVRTLEGTTVHLDRREVRRRAHAYYVTFPPGPAVVLLPFVAIFGRAVPDTLFSVLFGALAPALLAAGLARIEAPTRNHHGLRLAAALGLASPLAFVAPAGGVWFLAQAMATSLLVVVILGAFGGFGPAAAGPALAGLLATRPTAAVAAAICVTWIRLPARPGPREVAWWVVPSLVVGAALAAHNYARFGSPWEFGHRYLDVAWQPRIQTHGLFSLHYVPRNLHAMFLLLPKVEAGTVRVSVHGMSLLLACPWVAAAVGGRPYPGRGGLLLGTIAAAAFVLAYQNTGQVQFSPRFALDFLPFVLLHLALSGRAGRRWFPPLVAAGAAVHLVGAYLFVRAPGRLFVPSLWPYADGP